MSMHIELSDETIRYILNILKPSTGAVARSEQVESSDTFPSNQITYLSEYTISWAGYRWDIVQKTRDRIYCALDHIPYSTPFGIDTVYKNSVIAKLAAAFEHSLPADALEQAVETTVEGVTGKVFIPTLDMIQNEFDRFFQPEHRICKDMLNRSAVWWLSSPYSTGFVWNVLNNGSILYNYGPALTFGFRPFVALRTLKYKKIY